VAGSSAAASVSRSPRARAPRWRSPTTRPRHRSELWAHAIDVCQATGRPLPLLDLERMAMLCDDLMVITRWESSSLDQSTRLPETDQLPSSIAIIPTYTGMLTF
jgi:hypothetical protein